MATASNSPATPSTQHIRGAGKKATLAKRQLYASPLPVGTAPRRGAVPPSVPRTWWDRWNDITRWVSQGINATPVCKAWYDPVTNSVWMYDKGEAMRLWTHGFFGKGSLSRSEPTWAARKQAEVAARERGELTAEQMTQRRREERKLLKIERARAAVRAGIQLPDGITALGGELKDEDKALESTAGGLWRGDEDMPAMEAGVSRIKGLKYFSDEIQKKVTDVDENDEDDIDITNWDLIEHFQLTMIEAFFLAGMLGCLDVYDANDQPLSLQTLYQLCLASTCRLQQRPLDMPKLARPDNPFLLSYIVYHHFRSLGWVVKSGTKFCVDFLLYKRGPVFSHAEFSVIVVPEYDDEQDLATSPFPPHYNQGEKSWVWFSMMNRVNTQVQKVRTDSTHSSDTCAGARIYSLSFIAASPGAGDARRPGGTIAKWRIPSARSHDSSLGTCAYESLKKESELCDYK